jgi:hypothetical protein
MYFAINSVLSNMILRDSITDTDINEDNFTT